MIDHPQRLPSSRERLEQILVRLEARRGSERVFLKIYATEARAAADAADIRSRSGARLGPLDGMIVSIKDIFDVAGEPTLAGSVIRHTAAPAARDALVIERLRRAGAVILGKTNANEFCFTSDGINPHYGTPGNACDPALIPGGSSSGAGVSVAEGTSEIAIGSDTGGSVRIPAALNGVVGFKPTARRIPLGGAFPLSPTLDSIGPLARSVAECAAADATMAGDAATALTEMPLAGVRLGVPRGCLLAETEGPIATGFEITLDRLRRDGAVVSDWAIDDLLTEMRIATRAASIASVEAAEIHADWLRAGAEGVDPRTSGPLKRRLDFPAWAYLRMMRRRGELVAAMDERLLGVDALIMPTLPIFAPSIDRVLSDERFAEQMEALLLRNTQIANQFDLTAITLPLSGLPLPAGLMVMARGGEDRRLLRLAAGIERVVAS